MIESGTWIVPALITLAIFHVAYDEAMNGGGWLGGVLLLIVASNISLLAWLIWGIAVLYAVAP